MGQIDDYGKPGQIKARNIKGSASTEYLIYPSRGLKPSHLRTLKYLAAKNYNAVVVCNLPLTNDEQQQILPLCHQCIQRPNFGYDFGGYRDGVLSVTNNGKQLKHLLLLNDSTWFPIVEDTDWLADVQQLDLDFTAATSHFGIPRPDPSDDGLGHEEGLFARINV